VYGTWNENHEGGVFIVVWSMKRRWWVIVIITFLNVRIWKWNGDVGSIH